MKRFVQRCLAWILGATIFGGLVYGYTSEVIAVRMITTMTGVAFWTVAGCLFFDWLIVEPRIDDDEPKKDTSDG